MISQKYKLVAALAFGLTATPALSEMPRVAEDQTPTGEFLTAGEVRPILDATKNSWIGVRLFDGKDLIYFTHLLSWRCGLYEVQYRVNGGPVSNFTLPECAADGSDAIMVPEGTEIYVTLPPNSVETVEVTVIYDDLQTDTVAYKRAVVLLP